MHKPNLPEKTFIARVMPWSHQRDYCAERLQMSINNGCYNMIHKQVMNELDELLQRDYWTSTERWMLESQRNWEADPPDWVKKIEAEKENKELNNENHYND